MRCVCVASRAGHFVVGFIVSSSAPLPPKNKPQELSHRYRSPASTPKHGAGAGADGCWAPNSRDGACPASPSAAAAALAGGSLVRQSSIERRWVKSTLPVKHHPFS